VNTYILKRVLIAHGVRKSNTDIYQSTKHIAIYIYVLLTMLLENMNHQIGTCNIEFVIFC